jgi:hypothetical protein
MYQIKEHQNEVFLENVFRANGISIFGLCHTNTQD